MPHTTLRLGLVLSSLAIALLGASAADAQEVPKAAVKKAEAKSRALPTLLVFDLVNDAGVDKGVANTLAEMIIERVTNLKKYNVVGQKDLDKMLFWEQNKQLKGCTDTACLVQIAGAMGAQYYVEGSIGVLADRLRLIDRRRLRAIPRLPLFLCRYPHSRNLCCCCTQTSTHNPTARRCSK